MTEKQAILLLWYLVNASPAAFWKLMQHFNTAQGVLAAKVADWKALGIHAAHCNRLTDYLNEGKPASYIACLQAAKRGDFEVVFYTDLYYPKQLNQLTHQPPLLFIKGDKRALNQAQVAIVGTRKPTQSAQKIAEDFALHFAHEGLWVTSGLAEGIDKHAHIGALKYHAEHAARTVAVLGNGIDTCYPKKNAALYQQIIERGGAVVTEFLPHTQPLAHNFPRRNRIVSGLSMATLVVEAALKSGSLITAGYAAEQGKSVFAIPGHIYNSQAKGCHYLIREGAILVDSPEQVIEDINLPRRLHADAEAKQPQHNMKKTAVIANTVEYHTNVNHSVSHAKDTSLNAKTAIVATAKTATAKTADDQTNMDSTDSIAGKPLYSTTLSEELESLLNVLDWVGQDMDKLISMTQLDAATLAGRLMELELQGLVVQTGGLYLRCRQ